MNLQKTKIAIGGYQDIVRWAEGEHKKFCEELLKLESDASKAIYAPEKNNADRISLVSNFQTQMEKRKSDLVEAAKNCLNVYCTEKTPSKDTSTALNTVLQYLQVAGADISAAHLKMLLQPIYAANDIDSFNIISGLLKSKNIELSSKMFKLSQIDNLIREHFNTMMSSADRLTYLASEEAISSSLDPAKALTQMAVGNTFTGLLKYTDDAKEILQKMADISEIKEIDDTTSLDGFSFNFTPANSKF